MCKCLYCYNELAAGEVDFHAGCAKQIFGTTDVPRLPYEHTRLKELAKDIIRSQMAVTGVQPKLSLDIERVQHTQRFTIVGLWGRYILKPQTELYAYLPELEDVTMHLAQASSIEVVPHTLIRFQDGQLGYLTRRIDRTKDGVKIAMEDMCQLSEKLTEHKYRGSYEQIAKLIKKHSVAPMLDLNNFWEVVLFCFLTGNSDMHLKNFSLYKPSMRGFVLTPAYDLLNTKLALPSDTEELALTLNGKKSRLTKEDFVAAMTGTGLLPKVVDNIFRKFEKVVPSWKPIIQRSFLPKEMQDRYWEIVEERSKRLFGEDVK